MDSRTINKLIRAQVWPVLRKQGFSRFNSRSAWRDRGPVIDVVNFQSFNSYLAGTLGCTTFSFALNLGVYVRGFLDASHIRQDSKGRLCPEEYACPFRAQLKKRNAVDGFDRVDIFHIDSEGRTTSAVFQEAIALLETQAQRWFAAFGDLRSIVAAVSGAAPPPPETHEIRIGIPKLPGSYLLATCQLALREQAPDEVSAEGCLATINTATSKMLDTFSPVISGPREIVSHSARLRNLLSRLVGTGMDLESSDFREYAVFPKQCGLLGSCWSEAGAMGRTAIRPASTPNRLPSPRNDLWPLLRSAGFQEFTDRLAHRPAGNTVEVVQFLPVDRSESKLLDLGEGYFRIGLGVYWASIAGGHEVRRNRGGDPRPTLAQCQLQLWLVSECPPHPRDPTCFFDLSAARVALVRDVESWFDFRQDLSRFRDLLKSPDWTILLHFPTLRGQGGADSVDRCILHYALSTEERRTDLALLDTAEAAVALYSESRQRYFRSWLAEIRRYGTFD